MLFLATVLLFNKYLISKDFWILDMAFHIWLFGVYMALLYWEIRTRIRDGVTQKKIRWVGFHFTFWAGFFWGMFFSSRAMASWFIHPLEFLGFLFGFIASGVIFGIIGMAITQFMVLFVFKQPEQL
jgi:hypothetical protein